MIFFRIGESYIAGSMEFSWHGFCKTVTESEDKQRWKALTIVG